MGGRRRLVAMARSLVLGPRRRPRRLHERRGLRSTRTAPPRPRQTCGSSPASPTQPGLAADLYLPRGQAKGTAIVWIHGGGFVAGDKTQLAGAGAGAGRAGLPGHGDPVPPQRQGGSWFPASTLEDPGLQAAAASAVADANARRGLAAFSGGAAHGLRPPGSCWPATRPAAITAATAAAGRAAGTDPSTAPCRIAGAAIEPDRAHGVAAPAAA